MTPGSKNWLIFHLPLTSLSLREAKSMYKPREASLACANTREYTLKTFGMLMPYIPYYAHKRGNPYCLLAQPATFSIALQVPTQQCIISWN